MAKHWLAIQEKSVTVLRRSLIGLFSLTVVVGAVYLVKPWFWPGGLGMDKGETVTTERVEKDAKGIPVKTTTKHDDGKTLWDWLGLLGVPLSLAFLGLWFQWIQQKRAEDEAKEEVLQVYIDRLSMLLVDKNLLAIGSKVYPTETQENESQPKNEATLEERELLDSAVDVIRARTLSILRRFENDPERKTSVIRLLIDVDVVSKLNLDLSGVNLNDTNLGESNLSGANLTKANLTKAKLVRAKLIRAKLLQSDLSNANLIGANLSYSDLIFANLSEADLGSANLIGANLGGADLSRANLNGAIFGNNPGLTDADKAALKARGAIFEDTP